MKILKLPIYLKTAIVLGLVLFIFTLSFGAPKVFAAASATASCTADNGVPCDSASPYGSSKDLASNPIIKDINLVVNFLSIGIVVVVIAMLITGGIQYSAAGDNQQAVVAAKQRLINALIAFAAFLFTFAFLQWLIPGGIFG